MLISGALSTMPVAATMDLQYRLPPMQQVWYSPTIIISAVLMGIALFVVVYLSHRARKRAKIKARQEALKMVERILMKRGGASEDVDRMLYIFNEHPYIDPAAMVMIRERFHDELRPILERTFDQKFGERMETIYFPPPKDTRRILATQPPPGQEQPKGKPGPGPAGVAQPSASIVDLMDATLKPGTLVHLAFQNIRGSHDCLIMGHDMQSINLTLPANNDQLVGALRPGMRVEGMIENGPSLIGFSSSVVQAVAGSMPYCRITAWSTAWEVRKRDSVRLPISLEIDFQHISTYSADSIKMSNLDKEIGSIRPGRLMDISLGGCCIETPSNCVFSVGDMIRFSKSLVTGNPPATLLGAVVNADTIDPAENDEAIQRLHVQFLVIDDVSQRILVRTLRQLQDVMDREEWMQVQQMLQKMRRAKIQNIGSPSPLPPTRRETTRPAGNRPVTNRSSTRIVGTRAAPGSAKAPARPQRPSARSIPKDGTAPKPSARPSPRSIPKTHPDNSDSSRRQDPPLPPPMQ